MTAKLDSRRWQRAKHETKSLSDWKVDIARALVATCLWLLAMAVIDLPDTGLPGQAATVLAFAGSVALVLAAEFGWNYAVAGAHLAAENERRLREEQAELYQQRIRELEQAFAVSQAQYKVFQAVAEEEQQSGQHVPLAAQLARLEVATQVVTGDFGDK